MSMRQPIQIVDMALERSKHVLSVSWFVKSWPLVKNS